ncbi:M24 family metallopeptidase, partial [bacterium]|nr:M24 family metallopeptidase [bacterium]MCI5453049.1 M24 family metallopeptidase [bacterium]
QELQSLASTYMANECVAHGLLEKKEDITKVYWHSVSHHIGLDCHDVSDRQAKLEAGNVISDEPGLYFEELGIGVRIEDDLYITEKGCEVLTADIIKEVEDIEAFFAGGKRPF